jgi:hypothetical protein
MRVRGLHFPPQFLNGERPAVLFLLALFLVSGQISAESPAEPLAGSGKAHPPTPSKVLTVNYTGRLFGYYRMEPPIADRFGNVRPDLPVVGQFFEKHSKDGALLLGMGDNFAPEFGAAIQQEFTTASGDWAPCKNLQRDDLSKIKNNDLKQRKLFAPESLYKSEIRLPAMADCDNVTRFLMTAGYRAIVPGREDFIYSGTWLRRIALLLQGASDPGNPAYAKNPFNPATNNWNVGQIGNGDSKPHGKLHMLAANLRVKVDQDSLKVPGTKEKTDTKSTNCPLLFTYDLSLPVSCFDTDAISTSMDWLRRTDQSLDPSVDASILRQAGENPEFARQLVVNQAAILAGILTSVAANPQFKDILNSTQVGDKCAEDKKCDLPTKLKGLNTPPSVPPAGAIGTAGNSDRDARTALAKALQGLVGKITESEAALASTSTEKEMEDVKALATEFECVLDPSVPKEPCSPHVLLSPAARVSGVHLLLRSIAREQQNIGYTIAKLPDGRHALVIGVVGKETMQEISTANFKAYPDFQDHRDDCERAKAANSKLWKFCESRQALIDQNLDKAKPFDILVGDPRFVVTTLLRAAWEAKQPNVPDSDFDTVIVMAQMPHSEAYELGAHVRGDIQQWFTDDRGIHLYESCKPGKPSDPWIHDPCIQKDGKGIYRNEKRERIDAPPPIGLILSEAQSGYQTPNDMTMTVNLEDDTPVLTPADDTTPKAEYETDPVSSVSLSRNEQTGKVTATNKLPERKPALDEYWNPIHLSAAQKASFSAASLLHKELQKDDQSFWYPDYEKLWDRCGSGGTCQNAVLMQYLLRELEVSAKADVVLLKRRDFFFDWLGKDYSDYSVCEDWVANHFADEMAEGSDSATHFHKAYCQLHIALDRVLWRGDYSERVMIDGTTLTALMKTAGQQADQEQTLLAHDLHQEWLMTYGIVTAPPTNLVAAAAGPESFSVPGVDGCNSSPGPLFGKDSSDPGPTYCINGQSLAPDRAYWLTTSDGLADDQVVYKDLGAWTKKNTSYSEDPHYDKKSERLFLTTEIADEILRNRDQSPPQPTLAFLENQHQARPLFQLDFAKLVAGFSFTSPDLKDSDLANDYAGVTNTQASTPKSQELDLEAQTRLLYSPSLGLFTFGLQSDAEYDRKYSGNLTGSPETVTYSANSYSVGGFAQVYLPIPSRKERWFNTIDRSTRNLWRLFVVAAPYQYQRQLAPNYIAFPYFAIATTANPMGTFSKTSFLNLQLPIPVQFSQRLGFRLETSGVPKWTPDPGSYIEIGPEYTVQNNVLAAVLVPNLSPPTPTTILFPSCPATATAFQSSPSATSMTGNPLVNCVKYDFQTANQKLDGSTVLIPVPATLHAGGFYWNSHIQKNLNPEKNYSVSFDTSGDSYLLPGYTLTTQTRYAFSTKLAFNLKILPGLANLTLSPTYSNFYFENQGISSQRTGLVATTFSVSAKWYFARDAEVPFRKQPWFQGPASVDQTSSAKIK